MSEDDRMDRAERIRRMREGNRDDETTNASTEAGESATSEPDEASEPDASTATGDTETAGVTATESVPDAGQTDSNGEPVDTSDATESDQPTTAGTDESAAMEAAQRAAQAATQVTGGTVEGAATPDEELHGTGDISAAASPMQGPTGVELPDKELLEEALTQGTAGEAVGSASAAAMEDQTNQSEELVRVLEFGLGDEYYCLDIEYVEEIVKREEVTRVPNTDEYVEGVVDLRGQITTILDPKKMMDIDTEGDQNLIVVFDPEMFEEQGAVGWVVDEVRQVAPIVEDEVNSPPVDASYINGVVDRDDQEQFVIWVEPDDALEAAVSEDD